MKTPLVAILMVINASFCLAQAEYKSGYYITLSGDTVRGLIDFRGDMYNAKSCVFKASEKSDAKEFLPGEIKAYRFNNGRLYESLPSAEPVRKDSLYFYECLIRGEISVFFLRAPNRDYYLVQDQTGRVTVAQNNEVTIYAAKGTPRITNSNQYKGIFTYYFREVPGMSDRVKRLPYSKEAIVNITKNFFEQTRNPYLIFEKKTDEDVKKDKVKIGIGLLAYSGNSIYSVVAGTLRQVKGQTKGVGIAVEVSKRLTQTSERIYALGRVSYNKLSWEGDDRITSGDVHVGSDITDLKINGGFRYLTPNHQVRPYFQILGFFEDLHFSNYTATSKTVSGYKFPDSWKIDNNMNFGLAPGVGLLWGRCRIGYAYEISRKATGSSFSRSGHELSVIFSLSKP